MKKTWLKAKTLSEATMSAHTSSKSAPFIVPGIHLITQRVIEWHEAQRERTSEHWEVRSFKRGGVGQWVLATYLTREDAMVRKHNECVAKDYAVTVVHVTRYRRKKA